MWCIANQSLCLETDDATASTMATNLDPALSSGQDIGAVFWWHIAEIAVVSLQKCM
jgi:hypothetical protein